MRLTTRTIRSLAALALTATAVLACGDDATDPPPAAPQNVEVAELESGDIEITWSAVGNADSYTVERATGDGAYATLESDIETTSHIDDTVEPETEYRYRVIAVRGSQVSQPSADESITKGAAIVTLNGVSINADRTFHAETTYVLRGYVKVTTGSTLTIEPGTHIVGDYETPGSSLWILRGSRIAAEGTAGAPIVFTSSREPGERNAGDWGGIVIVGNGRINRSGTILTEGPQDQAVNYGGGTNNADDSGVLRYVRIEFAGYDITGNNTELNSLSSYAVGSGTEYDHVQTAYGLDDAFEWWGGAVDGRYLISYETGDDHFDASEGYAGRNQFLVALQTTRAQPEAGRGQPASDPRGFEVDGCDVGAGGCSEGFASEPFTMPVFANFTVVGPGTAVFTTNDGNGMVIRRGAGGVYVNGVVARWPGYGLSVRDPQSETLRGLDSLIVRNVVFAENARGAFEPNSATVGAERYATNFAAAAYANQSAADAEGLFVALPEVAMAPTAAGLDWTPAAGSVLLTAGTGAFPTIIGNRVQDFFGAAMVGTAYVGAADPGATSKWWTGWTTYARD